MKLLLKVGIVALMGLDSTAGAGSLSDGTIIGTSTRTYDLSMDEFPDGESQKHEADRNARSQCSSSQPILRISKYKVSQRLPPYSSYLRLRVEALYECGGYCSDCVNLSFDKDESLQCDHRNNFSCPSGYRCKIEWRLGPYDCVKIKP